MVGGQIGAYVYAGLKGDALGFHNGQAAAQDLFVQLEIGDAQGQQAADVFGSFVDRYPVSGAVELLGGGESGGAGADDGDFFAGADGWGFGADPAVCVAAVGDFFFDVFDGDRVGIDA